MRKRRRRVRTRSPRARAATRRVEPMLALVASLLLPLVVPPVPMVNNLSASRTKLNVKNLRQ